jgi:hypothetical protein
MLSGSRHPFAEHRVSDGWVAILSGVQARSAAAEGDVMTVQFDTPRPDRGRTEQPKSTRDQNRLLKIAVGVLAVVALVLGIVLVTDTTNGNDSAPPDDVAQVLDDYIAAWENQDVDGFRAVVTDDYALNEEILELDGPATPWWPTSTMQPTVWRTPTTRSSSSAT